MFHLFIINLPLDIQQIWEIIGMGSFKTCSEKSLLIQPSVFGLSSFKKFFVVPYDIREIFSSSSCGYSPKNRQTKIEIHVAEMSTAQGNN